ARRMALKECWSVPTSDVVQRALRRRGNGIRIKPVDSLRIESKSRCTRRQRITTTELRPRGHLRPAIVLADYKNRQIIAGRPNQTFVGAALAHRSVTDAD